MQNKINNAMLHFVCYAMYKTLVSNDLAYILLQYILGNIILI